jgi:quercetin dioxygenase-like cupin family protein
MIKAIAAATVIAMGVLVSTTFGTPASGVSAETARGPLAPLKIHGKFDNGAQVKLQTKGDIEFITQRIVAAPGATFGWHSHPGENVNVVLRGAITLYHDEACTHGVTYGPGTTFTTSPDQVHLARNETGEELVVFATYFAPRTSPPLPVRIDEAPPGAGCPQ